MEGASVMTDENGRQFIVGPVALCLTATPKALYTDHQRAKQEDALNRSGQLRAFIQPNVADSFVAYRKLANLIFWQLDL